MCTARGQPDVFPPESGQSVPDVPQTSSLRTRPSPLRQKPRARPIHHSRPIQTPIRTKFSPNWAQSGPGTCPMLGAGIRYAVRGTFHMLDTGCRGRGRGPSQDSAKSNLVADTNCVPVKCVTNQSNCTTGQRTIHARSTATLAASSRKPPAVSSAGEPCAYGEKRFQASSILHSNKPPYPPRDTFPQQ